MLKYLFEQFLVSSLAFCYGRSFYQVVVYKVLRLLSLFFQQRRFRKVKLNLFTRVTRPVLLILICQVLAIIVIPNTIVDLKEPVVLKNVNHLQTIFLVFAQHSQD